MLVVIISDGYVASKYFNKYDWIRSSNQEDDEYRPMAHALFSGGAVEGENPLKPFIKTSKEEEEINELIKEILYIDKKLVYQEHARRRGYEIESPEDVSPSMRKQDPISDIK